MPLYEFKCQECEHVFEVRQEWKAPYPACPECGSAAVKKVYHPAALVFKGSGWHVNDYASSSNSNGNGKSASAETKTETSASSTSESKSESGTSANSER